jgi:hypothetical protein
MSAAWGWAASQKVAVLYPAQLPLLQAEAALKRLGCT